MRTPIFELHIRPMFRLIDVEHMLIRGRNLNDRAEVARDWKKIHKALLSNRHMPTSAAGGPWPGEWIDLFKRWGEAGGPGLELNAGSDYKLAVDGDIYELSCTSTQPREGAKTWLDPLCLDPPNPAYRLVLETDDCEEPQGQPVSIKLVDRFRKRANLSGVAVEDANGHHRVPLTSG